MSKDEIDARRARQYAWSLTLPDEPSPENDAAALGSALERDDKPGVTETPAEATEEELTAWRAEIHVKADTLAAAVERVWNGGMSEEQQARQVEALLASAAELGLGMVAMGSEPLGPVRLTRLVNRHWNRLSEEAQKNAHAGLVWSHFEPALAVELLVEVCRDGNEQLAGLLAWPLFHDQRRSNQQPTFLFTGLAEQLITLLETADSLTRPWVSRVIALTWLQLAPARSAVPMLRRMLRLPHLEVRWRSLGLLLKDYSPPALLPEDVLFLLEDLLVHPPESGQARGRGEASYRFSVFLHEAITSLRPEGGARLLEELAFEGRGRFLRLAYRGDWEGKWALVALSSAYPEQALPHIDRCMRNSSSYARRAAVAAAAELPEAQARPRLVALAADGAPSVAEPARDCFIQRFAAVCPVAPLDGFPAELLAAPPSERFHGRLLCLRGSSDEARTAMVEVLLSEGPCPEALALLTFALCDDHLLDAPTRGRLPKDQKGMSGRLYRRFGGPAVAALCWLIERYPEHGLCDWLREVKQLIHERKIRKRDLEPLRALATRWLQDPDLKRQRLALEVLAQVGAPVELKERFLALARLDEPPYDVGEVLRRWPTDKALDSRILQEAREAWANRKLRKLSFLLTLGFGRRLRPFDRLAREILSAWEDCAAEQVAKGGRLLDDDAELPFSLALRCVQHLVDKKLDKSTLKTWLATPDAPGFLLATHLPLAKDDAEIKQALHAAAYAPAAPREAAQAAADVLLYMGFLHPDDVRVRELLGGAKNQLRYWVMHHIEFSKCKNRGAHRLAVATLLKTATAADEQDLSESLLRLTRAVGVGEVQKALAELPDQDLRHKLLAIVCKQENEPEYWQDEG